MSTIARLNGMRKRKGEGENKRKRERDRERKRSPLSSDYEMVCHRLEPQGSRREMRRGLPQTPRLVKTLLPRLPADIFHQLLGHTRVHTHTEGG